MTESVHSDTGSSASRSPSPLEKDTVSLRFHDKFSYGDGDIVLASVDGILFRVHAFLLKIASSVFRQMLEIPRELSEGSDDPIGLSEESSVIAFLLNTIYPAETLPIPTKFPFVWSVADAADKYDMPRVLDVLRIKVACSDYFLGRPLKLYGLACRYKWDEVIALATKRTLKFNISNPAYMADLEGLSARDLCALLSLRWKRKRSLLACLETIGNVTTDFRKESSWNTYGCSRCGCGNVDIDTAEQAFNVLREGVENYLERTPSGTQLLVKEFWENSPTAHDFLKLSCDHSTCSAPLMDLAHVMQSFSDVLRSLPTTV